MQSSRNRSGATLTAVAERAQVSRMTVSNALNNPGRLNTETLARVLRAIDDLGYRPNHAARTLRTQSTQLIGCRLLSVAPTATGGVIDRFMHSLCTAARASSYDVLAFAAADEDDEVTTFSDLMRRTAVDGFVLSGTHSSDSRADWLLEHGARFVAFGRPWDPDHVRHSWVDVDGSAGTAACVDHLVDVGVRRIGFLGWPKGSGVGDDRLAGWRAAMHRHGLTTTGMVVRGPDGIDSGAALAKRLLERGVDGMVCVSDQLAIGAMRCLDDAGIAVGTEVAVTGFDDGPAAALVRPGLTSVRQPLELAAQRIVAILADHLRGELVEPVAELLVPTLVIRASTLTGDPDGSSPTKGTLP